MKTQLDIYSSAHAAAVATLEKSTAYEVESAALEIFDAEQQSPKDFDLWSQTFHERRQIMLNLKGAKAPSAAAANNQ
jgi:hypothetical protein